MPPLIAKWNALKDEDKDLFPLLEVTMCGGVLALSLVYYCNCFFSACRQWQPLCKKDFFPIVSLFSSVVCP